LSSAVWSEFLGLRKRDRLGQLRAKHNLGGKCQDFQRCLIKVRKYCSMAASQYHRNEEVLLDGGESLLGEGEEVLLDGGESLLLGEGEEVLLDGGESLFSVKVRKCSMAASHHAQ